MVSIVINKICSIIIKIIIIIIIIIMFTLHSIQMLMVF